ncbi:hypothetical protein TD95_005320 [Thielaviopsis punctulata]|uniref:Aldose 1-epimerase n=1 Tax=Thielaviopsis punctulata TaxID=72032 RepID=A0A0F4ZGR0_9PEZI|nr:hypothetical protein TD95_005320 [Thielaviopsis punctulata]
MASISLLAQGAVIQSINVSSLNIVQSLPSAEHYGNASINRAYFGETIGRVANRIKDARIASLNGRSYDLAKNNGENNLHGGNVGWGKKAWTEEEQGRVHERDVPGIEGLVERKTRLFMLRSEDGEEGFPGTLDVKVYYTTGVQREAGKEVTVLAMEYEAELVGGADETVINMTNHSYFNLTGGSSIEGTQITLPTNQHLPLDAGGIPISGPTAFPGITPNTPITIAASAPDLDDCFTIAPPSSASGIDTRSQPLRVNLEAYHPDSRIHLQVLSTEPAFQVYTGKYINIPAVEGMAARGPRSGFCCEPGRYVNAVNEEAWRGQVVLKKGETYGARIVYRAWKDESA